MRVPVALFAAAAITGSTLLAAPATAQTIRHHDARHDVVAEPIMGDSATVRPARHQGDITWVRASFRRHSLFLSMRFRALSERKRTEYHEFDVVTDTGKHRVAAVRSGHRYPSGVAALMTRNGGFLHCRIQHRVSYRDARVTVTIPARCLGDHVRWVRVGFGEFDLPSDPADLAGTSYADDGFGGALPSASAPVPSLGPRVHRG